MAMAKMRLTCDFTYVTNSINERGALLIGANHEDELVSATIVPLTEANFETAKALYEVTLAANKEETTWSIASFQYELENENNFYLGYVKDGEIVGYIGCSFVFDEASINNFGVLPSHMKKGIGTALMEALIEAMKEKGVRYIYLEVRISNEPAISLYKKVGFEQIAYRKKYYTSPVEDAYVLYYESENVFRGE